LPAGKEPPGYFGQDSRPASEKPQGILFSYQNALCRQQFYLLFTSTSEG